MPLVWAHRGGGGAGGRALDRCRRHRARVLRHQPHPGDLRHLSELLLTPADPALVDTGFTLPSTADGIRHCSPSPATRSEEHTSELQSLMRNSYAVFCLKKT